MVETVNTLNTRIKMSQVNELTNIIVNRKDIKMVKQSDTAVKFDDFIMEKFPNNIGISFAIDSGEGFHVSTHITLTEKHKHYKEMVDIIDTVCKG